MTRFASPKNRDVPVAAPGEFAPLELGALSVWPPVVLAPMAGVTNFAFRSLCREYGAGLFVSEMITARGYLYGNPMTRLLAQGQRGERPRSIQIYGSDPRDLGEVVAALVADGVDHIDANFGCPVPKVTRQGGGSAIPAKPRLLARLVRAMVGAAGDVPITVKMRKGIDSELLTYRLAARVAQEEGASAVGLHGRTAAQLYSGEADWEAIADLAAELSIPVLGNGDIWEAPDALRMMRSTGCSGVIVGRGCLGRPWLFAELAALFDGHEPPPPPNLGGVIAVAEEHARRLVELFGEVSGMRQMRKWIGWYTKGFRGSARVRAGLSRLRSLEDLHSLFEGLDRSEPFPESALRASRAKGGRTQVVRLPEGYLDDPEDDTPPVPPRNGAELEAWERALGGG